MPPNLGDCQLFPKLDRLGIRHFDLKRVKRGRKVQDCKIQARLRRSTVLIACPFALMAVMAHVPEGYTADRNPTAPYSKSIDTELILTSVQKEKIYMAGNKTKEISEADIPVFMPLLDDESWVVRQNATKFLGCGYDSEGVLPLVIKQFKDTSVHVRLAAVRVTGIFAEKAIPAIPELLRILNDKNEKRSVRRAVIDALADIGKSATPAIPELVKFLGICPLR